MFRDRWLGCLEDVKEEKAEKLRLKQEKVQEDRTDTIDSIRRMLRDIPMLQEKEEEEEEESVGVGKREEQVNILDNWDEESDGSNDAIMNVPPTPTLEHIGIYGDVKDYCVVLIYLIYIKLFI